jgi:hypothetical protein
MRLLALAALAATLFATACGGGGATPIGGSPVSPAPATPTPAPTPTPNAFASACGTPLPPLDDFYGYGIKVQLEPTRNRKVLNASPLVRNAAYCTEVGQPGTFCRTRFETDPQRAPCDHYISGMSDESRPGPTWYEEVNGELVRCGGLTLPGGAPNCTLKPENQYLLDVRAPGKYVACGGAGKKSCGACILAPGTFGVIHSTPAGLCGTD